MLRLDLLPALDRPRTIHRPILHRCRDKHNYAEELRRRNDEGLEDQRAELKRKWDGGTEDGEESENSLGLS